MTVYMLQAGSPDGPVKIGVAADMRQRATELQVGSAFDLNLIRSFDGSFTVEAWLHRRFREHRIRGEWFDFADEMLTIEVPAALTRADAKRDASVAVLPTHDVVAGLAEMERRRGVSHEQAVAEGLQQRAKVEGNKCVWWLEQAIRQSREVADTDKRLAAEYLRIAERLMELGRLWSDEAGETRDPISLATARKNLRK